MKKFRKILSILLTAGILTSSLPIYAAAAAVGDVNADGEVNKEDVTLFSQYFAGWPMDADAKRVMMAAGDLNRDDSITRADAMKLARRVAGWEKAYTVRFEANADGVSGMPENQTVYAGEYAAEPYAPTKEGHYLLGWYLNPEESDFTKKFDFEETAVQADLTLYAVWMNIDTDSDGDGLPDALEVHLGTDIDNADSDGDGISDWHEVVTLGSDPLSTDSDEDGIPDDQEDTDTDGISDGDELSSSTNPLVEDTDGDGLSDYDEIYTYHTDPADADTDEDGVSDGVEIELDADPLAVDSAFTDHAQSQELSESNQVAASVEATVNGTAYGSVEVNPVTFADNMFLSQTIPGWMGSAYEFTCEASDLTAVITFEYDPALADGKTDFQPALYYFNPETQDFEELPDQTVSDGTVSAEVSHFSTYVLLNKTEYDNKSVSTVETAVGYSTEDPDVNDDYLPDCYNELIYSGQITLKNGSKAFVGYNFDGADGVYEDDYDGDGLLNGEEIEIRTDENGNSYIYIISSPVLADSDFDGYEDDVEIIRGTDPLTYTYNIPAVNGLYQNEKYASYQLAASVNEVGLHYTTLTLFTVLGAITEGADIQEIYRQEWFSYFNNYAEGAYKDAALQHESDIWIMNIVSMIDDINEKIGDYLGVLGDAGDKIENNILDETGIQDFIVQRTRLNKVLDDIRKSNLKSADFARYTEELKDVAVKQNELFEKYNLDYNSKFQVKLVNWTVDQKKTWTKIFDTGSVLFGEALDIISVVDKCAEVAKVYALTNANIQLYKDNIDIFDELKKSTNYPLHRAAYEIWILLKNDADDFSALYQEAIMNIAEGYVTAKVLDELTDIVVENDPYLKTLLFIAEQVIKIGVDMATDQNKTIASVNLTLAAMRVLDNYLDNYSTSNKFMSDRYLTHVAQMRLVNELRFNDCKKDPSFIAEQIQSVLGWADALHLNLSDDLVYDCKEVIRPRIKGFIHISNVLSAYTKYDITKEINGYYAGDLEVMGNLGYYEIYLAEGDHEITMILDKNGSSWTHNISIEEGDTLELDFYLDARINDVKLTGTVKDKAEGDPIEGALIRFREGLDNTSGDYMTSVSSALTDDSGKFVSEIPTGSYTIEITAPLYVTEHVNVEATQNRTVAVRLQKYGTVDFIVKDKNFDELSGVTVTVTASDGSIHVLTAPCSKYLAPGTYTASADINGTTVTSTFTLGTSSIIVTLKEPTTYLDNLPENLDFEGRSLRFIVDNEGSTDHLNLRSLIGDETSGEAVSEAVFNRNKIVSNRLNISIDTVKTDTASELNTYIAIEIMAGANSYDVAETMYDTSYSLMPKRYLMSVDKLEYINPNAVYWEAEFGGNAACAGYLPFITGDLSLQQHGSYYATFVNQDLWNQVSGYADIYKEVTRGNWTLDSMNSYISEAYYSLNGENGLAVNLNPAIDAFGTGAGTRFSNYPFTSKSDLIFEDETNHAVYEQLYEMICGNSGSELLDDTTDALSVFKEGNALFAAGTLNQASSALAGMSGSYYIVPMPKYSEDSDYHTRMSSDITVFSVPIIADSDFASIALEAMASESYRTVTSAYSAQMFDAAYLPDDSNAMLGFIRDCAVMDFAVFYPGTTMPSAFADCIEAGQSTYIAYETARRKLWEKTFEELCAAVE